MDSGNKTGRADWQQRKTSTLKEQADDEMRPGGARLSLQRPGLTEQEHMDVYMT